MTEIEPVTPLKDLFEAHGLTCIVENEWIVPNAELPAIRGIWYPQDENGRLDIHVLIKEGVLVEECFAGIGKQDKAFNDALHNFMVNSLHVFLAALWGKNDPEQVTIETWRIGSREFTAYIGNFGTRASAGVHADIPDGLFAAIESAIKNEKLVGDFHWVRTFFCNIAGSQTFEALLDNEDWLAGVEVLKGIPWEKNSGYYSVRNFIFLRAA